MSTPSTPSSPTPKPVSEVWRPELTRLPRLSAGRRLFRWLFRLKCKVALFLFTKTTIRGLENYPRCGPALIAINHLGDPDAIIVLAALPEFPEVIGKIELRDIPILRILTDWLGVIWVHRGQPDRRTIAAALEAFHLGRRVIIAPEGRESVSGALEEGTEGAAYLALKAGVSVVPVTVTGSEFRRIENGMKKLRRTPVTLTVGKSFTLPEYSSRNDALREGTRLIMEALARQLPPEYRGVYGYAGE